MNRIRVLIVDDEPLARHRIRSLVEQEPDLIVVGECALGKEAVEALTDGQQDLVFLDVRMPDMTGFDVLGAVGFAALPIIVFVTAYDDHALEAFNVRAVDYLLKPFDDERFASTLDRVRRLLARQPPTPLDDALNQRLRHLVESEQAKTPNDAALIVRSAGRTTLLAPDEIKWIEASGSYVRLHTESKEYLLRDSMAKMERTLAKRGFLRIHRSTIVRLADIRELRKHLVVLRDNTQLSVSERHWGSLQQALGI